MSLEAPGKWANARDDPSAIAVGHGGEVHTTLDGIEVIVKDAEVLMRELGAHRARLPVMLADASARRGLEPAGAATAGAEGGP